MRVEVKISPSTIIVAEADSQLELFQQLASLTEVFGEAKCNKCGGTYKYRVRTVQDGKKEYVYPELVCNNRDCRAKLAFGQTNDGALFPKRFQQEDGEHVLDENGRKVVKGAWGWASYNRETGKEE